MATKKTLGDLARALPDSERKQLLKRITRALSLHDDRQENVYQTHLRTEERAELVRRELGRLSGWERFRYWLKRISTGRSDDESFIEFKLDSMKRRIGTLPVVYVRFDRRTIEPAFARQLSDLSRLAAELAPFFRSIWEEPDRLRGMITHLLNNRVPNAKGDLADFIDLEEMQQIFLEKNSKKAIRAEVQRRLDDYLASIPDELFQQLTEGIMPMYLLKYVCLYPYRDLFAHFKNAQSGTEGGDQDMSPAPLAAVTDLLERLFYALYAASRVGLGPQLHPELLDAYEAHPRDSDAVGGSARHYSSMLAELAAEAREIAAELPLSDIIRVLRNDPYYKLIVYVPRLRLKDFHADQLRVRVFARIDDVFPQVRMGLVNKIQKEVFETEPESLDFYRRSLMEASPRLDAPPLRYFYALQTMAHFVRTTYQDSIATSIRLLARVIPVRYREIASELTLAANGIDKIGERVAQFDYGFSPESDDGKAFHRIRYAAERDIVQARTYRTIVVQKNREARATIADMMQHLAELEHVLRRIVDLGSRNIAERFDALVRAGGSDRLAEILERDADTARKLHQMLHQLLEMEDE